MRILRIMDFAIVLRYIRNKTKTPDKRLRFIFFYIPWTVSQNDAHI